MRAARPFPPFALLLLAGCAHGASPGGCDGRHRRPANPPAVAAAAPAAVTPAAVTLADRASFARCGGRP